MTEDNKVASHSIQYRGKIDAMAFGGLGITRQNGLVTFVPYTAIGDDIRYLPTKVKKNFSMAELVEVVHPGNGRTIPLCPYYGKCGGCQLQHVTYPTQMNYKRNWVEDAIKRQAGISYAVIPDVTPAKSIWNYRRRISLTLKAHENTFKAGYIADDQKSLVEVTQCQIFTKADDPVLPLVSSLSRKLSNEGQAEGKVSILKEMDERYILHFHFRTMPKNASLILKPLVAEYPFIKGILATSPRQSLQYGQIESSFTIDDLSFHFSPKAFVQNHPEQSLNIYHSLTSHIKDLKRGLALDLYCGVGVFSLLLGKHGFNTVGVELNDAAVQFATRNAKENGIGNVQFLKEDAEHKLLTHLKEKPSLVVINPPREGISAKVTQSLLSYPPEKLVYISCMPPTLGRDLKLLCDKNYHVDSIEIYDMFPQTTHVETVVILSYDKKRKRLCDSDKS